MNLKSILKTMATVAITMAVINRVPAIKNIVG